MTVLDEFYSSYLHYTVAQRLFEDTCRQLLTFKGSLEERQAMVDETLRLSMCVTDNIDETEGLIADTIEYIQSEDGDADLLEALSLITNNLKEDRARANSYGNYITYRRIGNRTRKPRKPQVANPFVPVVEEEDPIESIVIPPVEVQPDPEPIPEDEAIECEDAPVEVVLEEEETVPETSMEEVVEITEEGPRDEVNPLVEESERIMNGDSEEAETDDRGDTSDSSGVRLVGGLRAWDEGQGPRSCHNAA